MKYTGFIEAAEAAVRKLNEQRTEILSGSTDRSWIEQYVRFQGITELTREAVVTLIDKVYVYEDKRIKIDFNYRDEIAYYQELLQKKEAV